MNHQRGFTLVEMSASISVGSVLLVLAMGMVHRTMRFESNAQKHAVTERAAARLSRHFRHDIHQAESVSLDRSQADESVLQLVLPGQAPVSYRVQKSSLFREQPHSNTKTYYEQFKFPDNFAVRFDELSAPQRVVLTVEQETGLVGVPPRVVLHIEVVVGQFLKL